MPGLDGVIYSLEEDGRLSVLTTSAPDLVLEPRMACLAVNDDSDGFVEDESCGLLIGEKTTELFSLDTETGIAERVGAGVQSRPARKASEAGDGGGGGGGGGGDSGNSGGSGDGPSSDDTVPGWSGGGGEAWADGGDSQRWQQQQQQQQQQQPNSNLLLQRDEYVVRALDAETSEELWFVTIAHFSALDLEGRGGATALTRAKVAATDREGYIRAVRARSDSSGDEGGLVKALPRPMESDELDELISSDWGDSKKIVDFWMDGESVGGGGSGGGSSSGGGGSRSGEGRGGEARGGGQKTRRRGKFGVEHADRFPYLLYENDEYVVAMDPMDGSVLWRRQMPVLAVSLYGIRGREWVDIMPPPMSMLHPPPGYYYDSPSSSTHLLSQQQPPPVSWRLDGDGGALDWTPSDHEEPLLLLTNGDGDDDGRGAYDPAEDATDDDSASDSSCRSDDFSGEADWDTTEGSGKGNTCTDDAGSSNSGSIGSSNDFGGGGGNSNSEGLGSGRLIGDEPNSPAGESRRLTSDSDDPRTALVSASAAKSGAAGKMVGLLQPVMRQGQFQPQLLVLNNHFFASSSLRRGPFHAISDDASMSVQDRYPHPLGRASHRSFVDTAGRDARGGIGDAVMGGGGGGSVGGDRGGGDGMDGPPSSPISARFPPHAARPVDDGAGPWVSVGDRSGVAKPGEAKGDTVSGAGAGIDMGIGDWRRALLERVEKDMIEGKGKAGSGVHTDQKGLFMSWRIFAALVALVSAVVAGVAYMAYKYGAEAMMNMSTRARRGSVAAPQGAGLGAGSAGGNGGTTAGHESWRKASSLEKAVATPGRASPPTLTSSLSLQYGTSKPLAFNSSRAWEAAQGGSRNSLGTSSPAMEALLRRPTAIGAGGAGGAGACTLSSRESQMQRVHSLPAIHQSYSPAHGDRRGHREGWQALFAGSGESVAPDGAGAGAVGVVGGGANGLGIGRLERAVTSAVDGTHPLEVESGRDDGSSSSVDDDDPLGCFNWPESGGCGKSDPGDEQVLPLPPPLEPVRERVGDGANIGDVSKTNSSGSGGDTVARELFLPTSGASRALGARGGGGVDSSSLRCVTSGNSVSASSGEEGNDGDDDEEAPPRSGRDSSSATRAAPAATAGATAAAVAAAAVVAAGRGSKSSESVGRRRNPSRGHSRRGSREMGSDSAAALAMLDRDRRADRSDGDGDRRSDRDRDRERDRRPSRSPRASLCAAAEELVLDGGGGGDKTGGVGGGDGAGGVGADNNDALLVTNRRLRTEFVEGQKLGKGGFGTVFKCRNRLDGHDYAIKKIRLSSDRRWQPQLAKVLREVKIMSLLDHPNIVRYYQVRDGGAWRG